MFRECLCVWVEVFGASGSDIGGASVFGEDIRGQGIRRDPDELCVHLRLELVDLGLSAESSRRSKPLMRFKPGDLATFAKDFRAQVLMILVGLPDFRQNAPPAGSNCNGSQAGSALSFGT